MADTQRPGKGPEVAGRDGSADASRDDSLDQRRRDLDTALASRRAERDAEAAGAGSRDNAGFAQAMKLSSEFIAGIVVGAGLGWGIDYAAGTSPWGLIVFLLLGFCAGILNVLRAAGMMAESGLAASDRPDHRSERN